MAVKHLQHWSKADAVRRAKQGWELRASGATWDEIAEKLGYASAATACRSVRRFTKGLPAIDVEEMRRSAIERGLWLIRQAANDVTEGRPGAVTHMVRAEGRLAALCGLDQPRREQVIVGGESFWGELYRIAGPPRFRGELAAEVDVVEVDEVEGDALD